PTPSPVDAYWLGRATDLVDWIKAPTQGGAFSFHHPVSIRWFEDGVLNITTTCVDRHAAATPDRVAFFYEGEAETHRQTITYRQLQDEVCRFANVLKTLGVGKGDRVVIYMPMIPQAVYAMLACARIGAVHSVVFGGFSAHALHTRIMDCGAKLVITADGGMRGGKVIPLKAAVDEAIPETPVQHVLVVRHLGQAIPWTVGRDHDYGDLQKAASPVCEPEPMKAEDPLFILYTSGSTGTPKGVVHTCGGYLVYAAHTMQTVFDPKASDVFWCTADVGWITGHSYIVYGPLSMGVTQVLFEGVPTWPDASRRWQMVDRYGVTIFYTAPTAIRTLMRLGLDPLN
ncbi:MAG: AMP-binding protein, partial [Alphaproteobacteria bacterium]